MEKSVSDIFMVYNPQHGYPKSRHTTFDGAQNEAERLVRINPGKKFYVMGALGFAYLDPGPPIFTELVIEEEMPF